MLQLDDAIKFACVAKLDGKILGVTYRQGAKPLLSKEESELSVMQSLIRLNMEKTLESKLGQPLYSTTAYENETRATILLSPDGREKQGAKEYLMASFEKDADYHEIITKILVFLNSMREWS
jgi:hypothetical protein